MSTPRRAVVAACLVALAGCGTPEPVLVQPAAGVDAAATLAAFDAGDSAASVAGDEAALRRHETEPSLLFSLAAGRTAAATGRPQPVFRHIDPRFAVAESCFLAVAGLKLDGDEQPRTDVLHFGQTPAGWAVSHSAVVSSSALPSALTLADPAAVPIADVLPADRADTLAAAVFGRATGQPSPAVPSAASAGGSTSAVAPGQLVDGRLAGALQVYRQQLATTGAQLDRTLVGSEWAQCAARTSGGALAFLTLNVRDTVTGGALSGQHPDMIATGNPAGLSGATITIDRVEVFLLHVPDDPAAGATVLGLNDTATAAAVT